MYEPKSSIYNILKSVKVSGLDIKVYQVRPEVISSMPCITFRIEKNVPKYGLEGDIILQDVGVVVDIWGKTSVDTGKIMKAVEEAMRSNDYLLVYNSDVPDPNGYSHISTQFVK